MKKLTSLTTLAVLLILSIGCHKDDAFEDLPICIQNELSLIDLYCENANIVRYKFQGEKVYVLNFSPCVPDGISKVVDKDCNEICSLGGFGGTTICNGEDFYESAKKETLVWEI